MAKKVLVLGVTGLIGHQVFNIFKKSDNYEVIGVAYRNKLDSDTILIDARDEVKFISYISDIKPDYIINCIGILIDGANKNPENAIFLNAFMPHRLMRLANKINAKLVHISTDCVFSGNKKTPYLEDDEKDGKDTYAKTKGLGEFVSQNHLILRTSVVGPELKRDGEELFHWFMSQKCTINGFKKTIWSGVTTLELAKAVRWAVENNIVGLYHVTNNSSICKHDPLVLFKKHTKKEIVIVPVEGRDLDKSFVDTRKLIDYEIPSYNQMVEEMVELIRADRVLYSQYSS